MKWLTVCLSVPSINCSSGVRHMLLSTWQAGDIDQMLHSTLAADPVAHHAAGISTRQ